MRTLGKAKFCFQSSSTDFTHRTKGQCNHTSVPKGRVSGLFKQMPPYRLWETSQLVNEGHLTSQLWLLKEGVQIKFNTGGTWVVSRIGFSDTAAVYRGHFATNLEHLEGSTAGKSVPAPNAYSTECVNSRPPVSWRG